VALLALRLLLLLLAWRHLRARLGGGGEWRFGVE